MIITDYRVKSVLRTYAKQLQRAKLQKKSPINTSPSKERVTISEEAKKQLIFMGLSKQALEKLQNSEEVNSHEQTSKREVKPEEVEDR